MKNALLIIFFLSSTQLLFSQDNCNVFLWKGDSCRYKACVFLEKMPNYFQLTKEYHAYKDSALAICPEYAIIYKHKSTAYLKTGDFITWKKLIDKAVSLNPKENLDYRGWCRFQFFRDYQGAIDDIEQLEKITNYHIGWCQNGMYHLRIAKALCYKMLGNKEKAISLIENQIQKDAYHVGYYDYYHLGVLYYEKKQYSKALEAFKLQKQEYDFAENYYYKALVYKAIGKNYMHLLKKAKDKYLNKDYMYDVFTHQIDKVYFDEINNELSKKKKVMIQIKHTIYSIVLLILISCNPNKITNNWKVIYKNDKAGNLLIGSKADLIHAIRNGADIKIGWESKGKDHSIEHLSNPIWLAILDKKEVIAHLDPQVLATINWKTLSANYINTEKLNEEWRVVITTKGEFDAIWYDKKGDSLIKRVPQRHTITWFVKNGIDKDK